MCDGRRAPACTRRSGNLQKPNGSAIAVFYSFNANRTTPEAAADAQFES